MFAEVVEKWYPELPAVNNGCEHHQVGGNPVNHFDDSAGFDYHAVLFHVEDYPGNHRDYEKCQQCHAGGCISCYCIHDPEGLRVCLLRRACRGGRISDNVFFSMPDATGAVLLMTGAQRLLMLGCMACYSACASCLNSSRLTVFSSRLTRALTTLKSLRLATSSVMRER